MKTYLILMISFSVSWGWAQDQTDPLKEQITVRYTRDDFHDRAPGMAPSLVYKREFFERFEPQSVGDILKRLPGISGSADAGEFERPQLRGLPPQYTRIVINGREIPGAANDRTLVVDRIPAHLVERIEIIRAPGADQDAQGIGGTINIVLQQETSPRSDVVMGLTSFANDGEESGQVALNHAGRKGRVGYWVNGSYQNRHNPKRQFTDITEEDELIKKDERNILDADDVGFSGGAQVELPNGGSLEFGLNLVSSDREENEDATFVIDGELDEHSFDMGTGKKENMGGHLELSLPIAAVGRLDLGISHQQFEIDSHLDVGVFEDGEALIQEIETDQTEDQTTQLRLAMSLVNLESHQLKFGTSLGQRERHARSRLFEVEEGEREEVDFGGVFRIEEERFDLFIVDTWNIDTRHSFQTGLRWEQTRLKMLDAGLVRDEDQLFPSLHYRYQPSRSHRFNISLARTQKRPDFRDLQPFEQRDQPFEDQVTLGNPNLEIEYALGLDVGYQHAFQDGVGVVGFNLYYRDITDLVEILQRDDDVFQVDNSGDGKTFGVELDFGMPLTQLGLPGLSVFANLAWQDSEITDPYTGLKRPFNLQSEYVFNFSFLHRISSLGLSYGFTWLSQGRAEERFLNERSLLEHPDNLDFLLESRLLQNWSLRLSAKNLLDASKDVLINEYEDLDGGGALLDEREFSGRSYQLILRGRFRN